jgi:uncharacterized protein YmfQ (DUF2313 family)
MTKVFEVQTKETMTDSVTAFMPGGRVFAGKNRGEATLRKYLSGLAIELFRIDEQMNLMSEDHDITKTTQFIEQWESAVGIPDDCFLGNGTLIERRRDVLAKFAKMNLTTDQSFIDLAALFGITVTITPGGDEYVFPLSFPISLIATQKEARFTMVVRFPGESEVFPLAFPIAFGFPAINLIKCLFNKSKPGNVQIIYQ